MNPQDLPPSPLINLVPVPEPWISVLNHPNPALVNQAALVLTARTIDARTHRLDGLWHLLVRERDLMAAKAELAAHRDENRITPPGVLPALQTGNGWWAVAAFLAVIWFVPWVEATWLLPPLKDAGAFDVSAVRAGEWWLAATALTLHADLAHIATNSLFGGLFGFILGRWMGAGVAWLLTLVAAMAANLTHTLIQPEGFRAIGASTAVFAALGLTGIFAWRRGVLQSGDRKRRFAPAFAAIAMIALTGTGGENTDLFGHFFGFGYGCLAGYLASRLPYEGIGTFGQWICSTAAFGVLVFCWISALG
ncbi:MAG: rhomboid family intramembrane serine protease [Gammaproteobacteria bacterium]|nr:rhomboid family intramembrane serine protease [Gammaproteobacteria bacterium]